MEFVFVVLATLFFVLLRFTVRAQVWQNLCRICAAVGPPWLWTEAPDHQQTDIWLQILIGGGRVLQTVLVPSAIHWYICWRGWGLSCIPVSPHGPVGRNLCFFGPNLTSRVVCVHIFYIFICFSPNTAFHPFVKQTLMTNWVKSFFEINQAWKALTFVLVCLSIRVFRVNTWSVIW